MTISEEVPKLLKVHNEVLSLLTGMFDFISSKWLCTFIEVTLYRGSLFTLIDRFFLFAHRNEKEKQRNPQIGYARTADL